MKFKKGDKVLHNGSSLYGTIDIGLTNGWLPGGQIKSPRVQQSWSRDPIYRVIFKKEKYPKKIWIRESELELDISYYRNKQIEAVLKRGFGYLE